MSGMDRKAIRAAAKAALAGALDLSGATEISAWVQTVDADALPAYAVATPVERETEAAHGTDECSLSLIVVYKCLGGDDVEDDLDDMADVIKPLIMGAVATPHQSCLLTEAQTKADGGGEQRVGTLTMTFTVTYWVEA